MLARRSAILSRPEPHSIAAEPHCVVAVYESRIAAEVAIRPLVDSEFDMQNLSVIGMDYTTAEVVVGFSNSGDCMKAWAKTGAFSGGLWGTLRGSALFVIPGIGPLFAAGPLVGQIISAMEEASNEDMTALRAGLYSVGIPKAIVLDVERKLKGGRFIVITHGRNSKIENTRIIPARAGNAAASASVPCAQRPSVESVTF